MIAAPAIALAIIAVVVVATILFALRSIRNLKMDPQEFVLGGRSFGAFFLWVLLAGEVYTAFTFLGAAGWAYGQGAPAFYILAYGTCGFIIGYFLLPAIWKVGKDRGLLTAPDFFVDRYRSKALGTGIGLLQVLMIVPYLALQLTGLQILLTIASYGHFNATLAVAIAFGLMTLFVFTAGLRGTAWASVVKDLLVLGAVIFAGVTIPMQFFGSPANMFTQLLKAHPAMLTLVPGGGAHGTVWFVSTVLLTSIGFYMGPQYIAATYSARDANVLRRNAMFLPLYQLVLLLVFFAGFSALLIVPGLNGGSVDQSFLLVVQRYYSPVVLGFVAAAGALAALIPASALLLASASVLAKNVVGKVEWTRPMVLAIAVLSVALWIVRPQTLVEMLLLYYSGITQFMPGVACAFLWKRANAVGVASGIVVGIAISIAATVYDLPLGGVNPGFAGLIANATVLIAVSLLTYRADGNTASAASSKM